MLDFQSGFSSSRANFLGMIGRYTQENLVMHNVKSAPNTLFGDNKQRLSNCMLMSRCGGVILWKVFSTLDLHIDRF